jgi:hypothetical protein
LTMFESFHGTNGSSTFGELDCIKPRLESLAKSLTINTTCERVSEAFEEYFPASTEMN